MVCHSPSLEGDTEQEREGASQQEPLEKGKAASPNSRAPFAPERVQCKPPQVKRFLLQLLTLRFVHRHVWHEAQTQLLHENTEFVCGQLLSYEHRSKKGKEKIELHKYFHSFRVDIFHL